MAMKNKARATTKRRMKASEKATAKRKKKAAHSRAGDKRGRPSPTSSRQSNFLPRPGGEAPEPQPTREFTAAHEAGHAIVFLACGIPVEWVEIRTHWISPTVKRFGFTQAAEDDWMAKAALPRESKLVRRILGKAGGLAGEIRAKVFEATESVKGALDDMRRMGGGLVDLGLVPLGTNKPPMAHIGVAIEEAVRLLERNAEAFDRLRQDLLANGRVDHPAVPECWSADDDQRVMSLLAKHSQPASKPPDTDLASGSGA